MKKKPRRLYIFYFCIAFSFIALFDSCTSPKNVVYFKNLQKDTSIPSLIEDNFELKIRKNDLIDINIISPDPISTPLFNGMQSTSSSLGTIGSIGSPSGYLVGNDGSITIYKLGQIHVEGLTRNQLKQKLEKDLAPYLKDAVVSVKFLNNRVTVLGEVTRPQIIPMQSEKLTLLEALSMAGDITITGRKDNILVIRETSSGKDFKRLNLTDNSIFTSPYYYLRPDDVVYIEPTETKIKNSGDTPQIIGYILTGISIAITLLLNLSR